MVNANLLNLIFCILVMAVVLIGIGINDNSAEGKALKVTFVCVILFFVSEMAWCVIDGKPVAELRSFNYFVTIVDFASEAISAFCWFRFCQIHFNTKFWTKKLNRIISTLPAVVFIALTIASIWTGWFFYIDNQNCYIRGDFIWVNTLFLNCYPVAASILSLHRRTKVETTAEKENCLIMASYMIFPIVFGLLQMFFDGMLLECFGITLSVIIVFMGMQRRQITIDPLTKINNRYRLEEYMMSVIEDRNSFAAAGQDVYLYVIDADKFKEINDTYGHIEGDRALILIAGALASVCNRRDAFLARFGGDEFIIIDRQEAGSDPELLKADINAAMVEVSKSAVYNLSVSAGYAKLNPMYTGIQMWLSAGDAELYKEKKAGRGRRA